MAAAISASFLSPLAAVIFVQEVVLRQWRLYQFIPIAAAAVAASETAVLLDVHFIIPSEIIPDFVNPYEFIFFGIIGLLCGGLAIAFNRALPAAVALVGKRVKIDNRLKPALGGLVLAGIGFYFPSVLGLGGYETQLAVAGGGVRIEKAHIADNALLHRGVAVLEIANERLPKQQLVA